MPRSKKKKPYSRRTKSLSPRSRISSHNTRRRKSYSPIRTATSLERKHRWKNPTSFTRFHQFYTPGGDRIPDCCKFSNQTTVSELKVIISEKYGVPSYSVLIYSHTRKKKLRNNRTNLLAIKDSLYIIIDPLAMPPLVRQFAIRST